VRRAVKHKNLLIFAHGPVCEIFNAKKSCEIENQKLYSGFIWIISLSTRLEDKNRIRFFFEILMHFERFRERKRLWQTQWSIFSITKEIQHTVFPGLSDGTKLKCVQCTWTKRRALKGSDRFCFTSSAGKSAVAGL